MRVCRRQSWTLEQFGSLSANEQTDWLADDLMRQELLETAVHHAATSKSAEVATLILVHGLIQLEKI